MQYTGGKKNSCFSYLLDNAQKSCVTDITMSRSAEVSLEDM